MESTRGSSGTLVSFVLQPGQKQSPCLDPHLDRAACSPLWVTHVLGCAHKLSLAWIASSGRNPHPAAQHQVRALLVRALLERCMATISSPAAAKPEHAAPWHPAVRGKKLAMCPLTKHQTKPTLEPQHSVHRGGLWGLWGQAQDSLSLNLLSF